VAPLYFFVFTRLQKLCDFKETITLLLAGVKDYFCRVIKGPCFISYPPLPISTPRKAEICQKKAREVKNLKAKYDEIKEKHSAFCKQPRSACRCRSLIRKLKNKDSTPKTFFLSNYVLKLLGEEIGDKP
jgi:hypothetical protein